MYRFRIDYYLKRSGQPQLALFVGTIANNFADAETKAIKLIKKKYPKAGYDLYKVTKLKGLIKTK